MTQPASGPQPEQEQIAFQDILDTYRTRVSQLEHELVLATCRIKNRDDTIEALMRELDSRKSRELPNVSHQ